MSFGVTWFVTPKGKKNEAKGKGLLLLGMASSHLFFYFLFFRFGAMIRHLYPHHYWSPAVLTCSPLLFEVSALQES